MTTLMARCPRCAGSLLRDWGDLKCIACGHVVASQQEPAYVPHPPFLEPVRRQRLGVMQLRVLEFLFSHPDSPTHEVSKAMGRSMSGVLSSLHVWGYVDRARVGNGEWRWRVRDQEPPSLRGPRRGRMQL